jgi:hypothetical protein
MNASASQLVEVDAPLIAPSARKHGIPDSHMIHAFNHPIFVEELDDGFTMFVGADPAANLLEIGVVDTSDGPIIVHAMSARTKYLR